MRSLLLPSVMALLASAPAGSAYSEVRPTIAGALSAQIVGVVGSGDKIALQLKVGETRRTLRPGDIYEDGWVLSHLTPTSAVLTRNGVAFELGLNPGGRISGAPLDLPPSQVTVNSGVDAALLQRLIDSGKWDGKPKPGLTLEETQRSVVYGERLGQAVTAGLAQGNVNMNTAYIMAALGGPEAMADSMALTAKSQAGVVTFTKPFYQAAGQTALEAARAAGLGEGQMLNIARSDPPDAQGGRMVYPVTQPSIPLTAAQLSAGAR